MTPTEERLSDLLSQAMAEPARPVDLAAVAGRVRRRRQGTTAGAAALACVAIAVTVAVAGAGGPSAPAPAPGASPPVLTGEVRTTPSDASVLIGNWQVEATGEEAGAVLRIAENLSLRRQCGEVEGVWAAVDDQFVGLMFEATPACATGDPTEFTPRWLARAQRFMLSGGRPMLLDGSGAVVARLLPTTGKTSDDAFRAAWRRQNTPALPLPAGLTPASRERLLGRWVPLQRASGDAWQPRNGEPHVLFRLDGAWTGSDGCNSQSGMWALGGGGVLVTARGISTLVGCNAKLPDLGLYGDARRAAFDQSQLVLLDRRGKELARFRQG